LASIDARFEVFPDPVNKWTVWDNEEDDFAEVGTQVLHFLSEREARAFCILLNILLSEPEAGL
jgi:hypothetical protein